jgi:hypothetical protein
MSHRIVIAIALSALSAAGCSRVVIATGTTLGMKATPGDGSSRPPQVTLGYKRAELALVPTKGGEATDDDAAPERNNEAYSTLASFFFQTAWFGKTELESFIATGHAARKIQGPDSNFNNAFALATLDAELPAEVVIRQDALFNRWAPLSEDQAAAVLRAAGSPKKPDKTAKESLQDYLNAAQSDEALATYERALAAE